MPLQRAWLLLCLAGVQLACDMYTSCRTCRRQCELLGTPSCIDHNRVMLWIPQEERRTPGAGGRGCNHLLSSRRAAGDSAVRRVWASPVVAWRTL